MHALSLEPHVALICAHFQGAPASMLYVVFAWQVLGFEVGEIRFVVLFSLQVLRILDGGLYCARLDILIFSHLFLFAARSLWFWINFLAMTKLVGGDLCVTTPRHPQCREIARCRLTSAANFSPPISTCTQSVWRTGLGLG